MDHRDANVCYYQPMPIPTIEPCLTATSCGVPQWRWRTRWLGCVTRWPSRRQSRRRHWVRSRQPSRASSAHDSRSVSRRRPFPTTSREQKEAAFGREEESAEGARVGWQWTRSWRARSAPRSHRSATRSALHPSSKPSQQVGNSHPSCCAQVVAFMLSQNNSCLAPKLSFWDNSGTTT